MSLILTGCGGNQGQSPDAKEFCALQDQSFPRPEPEYTGKLKRDFTPFTSELEAYTTEQAAEREALITSKNIPELQTLIEDGQLSAVELVVFYLDRIQRFDIDQLNSVLELNPEALEIAEALDAERLAAGPRSPMHGIPVLLKDNIATADQLHTAAGAAAMLDWEPERDAFLAGKLRDAGAIILGKANLSEWANWMDACLPNGFSANGGQTRNPYGPFETSGSSSGSAVSAAADLVTVSVGTETIGSIISPAEINSVVGLKTSLGLVSRDYIIPLLPAQDVPGPIGRTVTDVAVLLTAMSGVDDNDPETANAAALAGTDFTRFLDESNLSDVVVGLPLWNDEAFETYFEELGITDADAQANLRAENEKADVQARLVGEILRNAGVNVIEIPHTALPDHVAVVPAMTYGYKLAINEFLSSLGQAAPIESLEAIIAFNGDDLPNRAPYGQDHLEASQSSDLTEQEFQDLVAGNQQTARERINDLFEQYGIDIIASDVEHIYAPAGYPALTVPSGYADDGTPRGAVFVGGFLSEPQLLAVGYAFEQAANARIAPNLETTTQ